MAAADQEQMIRAELEKIRGHMVNEDMYPAFAFPLLNTQTGREYTILAGGALTEQRKGGNDLAKLKRKLANSQWGASALSESDFDKYVLLQILEAYRDHLRERLSTIQSNQLAPYFQSEEFKRMAASLKLPDYGQSIQRAMEQLRVSLGPLQNSVIRSDQFRPFVQSEEFRKIVSALREPVHFQGIQRAMEQVNLEPIQNAFAATLQGWQTALEPLKKNAAYFKWMGEQWEKMKRDNEETYEKQRESLIHFLIKEGYIIPFDYEEFAWWFFVEKHGDEPIGSLFGEMAKVKESDFREFHEYKMELFLKETQQALNGPEMPLLKYFKDQPSLDLALRAATETEILSNGKWAAVGLPKTKVISIFWRAAVKCGLAKAGAPVYKVVNALGAQFGIKFGKNSIDLKSRIGDFEEELQALHKRLEAMMRP